jgi:hypothetical protein
LLLIKHSACWGLVLFEYPYELTWIISLS